MTTHSCVVITCQQPLISKVFKRLIYNQLSEYTEGFLNHILCGFRKAHSTQYALIKLLQSWQKELDNGGFVGTILMDNSLHLLGYGVT